MKADVLDGLRSDPKYLPSQYLYDARGAKLFEAICELPEYYLTRTEAAILESEMASISADVGPQALVIEPGSGDGAKSKQLLAGLSFPSGYMPIDISRAQLVELALDVSERFPTLEVLPVCADFTTDPDLPSSLGAVRQRVAYLPGSTIGNFGPEAALDLLRTLRRLSGPEGSILIGVDTKKDRATLEAAYDDAQGISRAFALNYLVRLNRELAADFDLSSYSYRAPYDEAHGRIEMAIVSLRDQRVHVGGEEVSLARGEHVRTEFSYKYTPEEFAALAARADLRVEHVWTDPAELFSVHYLVPR